MVFNPRILYGCGFNILNFQSQEKPTLPFFDSLKNDAARARMPPFAKLFLF